MVFLIQIPFHLVLICFENNIRQKTWGQSLQNSISVSILAQHFLMACATLCLCMQCSGYTAYLEPQYHDSHGWYTSLWALQFREPFWFFFFFFYIYNIKWLWWVIMDAYCSIKEQRSFLVCYMTKWSPVKNVVHLTFFILNLKYKTKFRIKAILNFDQLCCNMSLHISCWSFCLLTGSLGGLPLTTNVSQNDQSL